MHGVTKVRSGERTGARPSRRGWHRVALPTVIVVAVLGVWWATAGGVAEVEDIRPTAEITAVDIDGVLVVTGTCPRLRIGHCGTDAAITLPPSVAVSVATGAGSIAGVHASGPIRATTAAGSIELTVTQDVEQLSVATGAGSIDLNVPDATYDVTARTGLGRTRVEVATATDAPRTIDARSDVGSVTIRSDPR